MDIYRPGHADYTFDQKYGFRDYRGGGRSSGRETIARVAAGAIACRLLESLGITVRAYTREVGGIGISRERFDLDEMWNNRLYMPDAQAAARAETRLEELMAGKDSVRGRGGMVLSAVCPPEQANLYLRSWMRTWLRPWCPSARSRDLR